MHIPRRLGPAEHDCSAPSLRARRRIRYGYRRWQSGFWHGLSPTCISSHKYTLNQCIRIYLIAKISDNIPNKLPPCQPSLKAIKPVLFAHVRWSACIPSRAHWRASPATTSLTNFTRAVVGLSPVNLTQQRAAQAPGHRRAGPDGFGNCGIMVLGRRG